MTPFLDGRLPIWEVADDTIITKMGDCGFAYELTPQEIFTQSPEAILRWHRAWGKAPEVLLPRTVVHKQDYYWQTRWQGDFEKEDPGFLSQSNERYHHERPWLDHRCYLFITMPPAKRGVSPGRVLLQEHLTPQDTLSQRAMAAFRASVSQFIQILTDSGTVQCRRLSAKELYSREGEAGVFEQYCQQIMPGESPELRDIRFGEHFRIGDNHCSLYTISDAENLPSQCSPGLPYPPYSTETTPFFLGNSSGLGLLLPCNHIYSQYLIIQDAPKVRKKLEQKRRRMQSLSAHSRENALGKEAVDAFLNETIAGGKLMVKVHFNILLWTDNEDDLPRLRDLAGGAITKLGAVPHLETEGAALIWYAGIPGNGADLPHYETFDILAEQAICFLTSDGNYRSSVRAGGMRLGDRLYGRPLQVDLSDEPMRAGLITNLNKFVLGGSGSGKSFLMNHLLHSYYRQGAHMVVVDIGNSYRGLCSLVEGYYFTYTETNPLSLNPFWMPAGETPDTEKFESLKVLLLTVWKKEDEPYVRSEYVALSNVIQLYFKKLAAEPDIFPCFDSFYEFLRDEFSVLLTGDKVKTKDFDLENFLFVLRPFYKGGEYDFLLNARQQLDLLQQRFIVFELDTVKDHPILFPVVTIVIMEVFIGKMRRLPGVRKVILIEEAWKAIARQGMSEYIKYLFKTVRKFNGEAIIVTQEVEDILSSPVVKQAILNNADGKILLDQSKFRNKFDQLQQLLGSTEQDKALVLSLNQHRDPKRKYREVFISLGANCSKVYRIELSMEEYLTYTTDEREKQKVQEWAKRYGSLQKGIAALAAALRDGSFKWLLMAVMLMAALLTPSQKASAQFPIADIIQAAVKKVIVATDLAIQRLQTQTITLQNAQKSLENAMQLEQLTDIADWVQHQKDLFAGYYQELWQIKNGIALYHRVREITEQQTALASTYRQTLSLLRQDPHFSPEELAHITAVYGQILDRSIQEAGQLVTIVTAFVTQMEDGDRLAIIDQLGAQMDRNRRDLIHFTQENILLSLQRSKSLQEIKFVQILYNIH